MPKKKRTGLARAFDMRAERLAKAEKDKLARDKEREANVGKALQRLYKLFDLMELEPPKGEDVPIDADKSTTNAFVRAKAEFDKMLLKIRVASNKDEHSWLYQVEVYAPYIHNPIKKFFANDDAKLVDDLVVWFSERNPL